MIPPPTQSSFVRSYAPRRHSSSSNGITSPTGMIPDQPREESSSGSSRGNTEINSGTAGGFLRRLENREELSRFCATLIMTALEAKSKAAEFELRGETEKAAQLHQAARSAARKGMRLL